MALPAFAILAERTTLCEGEQDTMAGDVKVFMDYENIRVGLWRHFQRRLGSDVPLPALLTSIRDLANEIGSLYEAHIFGDWTLRAEDARVIEATPQFRAQLVLRAASKKDRTDPAMNFAIDDAFRETSQIDNILLCAGDSDYCEVVRRGSRINKNFYVCAVGAQTAPELLSLSKAFYPIEQRLGLRPKEQQELDIAGLDANELNRWTPLIRQMDRAEQRLQDVVRSHFINAWMSPGLGYGQDFDDKAMLLDSAVELGILFNDHVPHPETGRPVRTLRLNREHPMIKALLLAT